MTNEIVKKNDMNQHELSVVEQVVLQGDLAKLDPSQRVLYYHKVCESAGLNPFTKPFEYISLNGKLTLYATKSCTEQLRKLNGISIEKMESKVVDDLYIVKVTARTKDGRTDESTGAVVIGNFKGDAKANAIMKAETKAKRRVTLSIAGMGWCDESEIETIPNARPVTVDLTTGEVQDVTPPKIEDRPKKDVDMTPITKAQLDCLLLFIDNDDEYLASVMERLAKLKIMRLEDIPAIMFEKVLNDAKNNFSKREEERFGNKEVAE
jgi:hypothetical protein